MFSNLKSMAAGAAQSIGSSELLAQASSGVAGAMTMAKSAFGGTYDVGGIQIHIGQQLAEGGYSFVHLAEEVGTGRQFALKRVVMNGMEANKNARHELKVLKALQGHRNIMKLYSHANIRVKRDGMTELLLLCELATEGHLYDVYLARGGQPGAIEQAELFDIFTQCCEAVGFMHAHEPPLAHRDIKIENFLVTGGVVKLCDFGGAQLPSPALFRARSSPPVRVSIPDAQTVPVALQARRLPGPRRTRIAGRSLRRRRTSRSTRP